MFVKNAMTKSVITSEPDVTVRSAAEMMSKRDIGSLIIIQDEKMIGIMTERDVMKKVVSKGKDPEKTKISEVMTKKVITTTAETRLDNACKKMEKNHIKKLPVMEKGELIGILTTTDIVSYEPKLAGYIYKLVSKKEKEKVKKSIKPLLLTNFLLVLLLVASMFIFLLVLKPLVSHPTITRRIGVMIYSFVVILILLSSLTGIMVFRILSKKGIF
ncbi:MAG: CBS domain-containing protein [Candidatus Aenigmarchaeota archaeon]|nr:CBS domain-containing protein [Candidatus Aenigmarchaeota archaeon]